MSSSKRLTSSAALSTRCSTRVVNYSIAAAQLTEYDKIKNTCLFQIRAYFIYLDLQKAFDKDPHRRLLMKLNAHGIIGNVLQWIENWLTVFHKKNFVADFLQAKYVRF